MDATALRSKIAFIDIEASGLMTGSFPVEAAWITSKGRSNAMISPSGHWDDLRWDLDAEAMHGITLLEARRKGRHPKTVAASLERDLAGLTVFTDSPVHDTEWADMIHSAGGVRRSYRIETVGKLLGHLGIKADLAYRIFQEVRMTHPPRGRAMAGAIHLEAVFEAAARRASTW